MVYAYATKLWCIIEGPSPPSFSPSFVTFPSGIPDAIAKHLEHPLTWWLWSLADTTKHPLPPSSYHGDSHVLSPTTIHSGSENKDIPIGRMASQARIQLVIRPSNRNDRGLVVKDMSLFWLPSFHQITRPSLEHKASKERNLNGCWEVVLDNPVKFARC